MIGEPVFVLNNRINWDTLSINQKVKWCWLSANRNATHILEQNLDKVDWYWLVKNPNAIYLFCKLDTIKMRETNKCFAEELVSVVFHPMRLNAICETYQMELEDLVDMY
jgi:hypothetical protein